MHTDVPNPVSASMSDSDTVREEFEGSSLIYGVASIVGGVFFFGFFAFWGFFFFGAFLSELGGVSLLLAGSVWVGLVILLWAGTAVAAFLTEMKVYITDELVIYYRKTPFKSSVKERKLDSIKNVDVRRREFIITDGTVVVETDMDSKDLTMKHIVEPYSVQDAIVE